MRKTVESPEYRVSQRSVLRPGDRFTASGGPYWRASDGRKIPLAARGPFRFISHCRRGKLEWINAYDRDGIYCPLHIAGRRRRISSPLVTRPYVVRAKKRTLSQRLDNKRPRR